MRENFDFRSPTAANTLAVAVERGNDGFARQLLVRGAPVNGHAPAEEFGPNAGALAAASGRDDLPMVETLLEDGAGEERDQLNAALLAAAGGGDLELTRLLLGRGADPNGGGPASGLPLVRAARRDDPHMVAALLAAGADPNRRGSDGRTALFAAVAAAPGPFDHAKRDGMLRELLAAGADVNAQDNNGDTPLHVAASELPALLAAGADPWLSNKQGQTPLEAAEAEHNMRKVAILRAALAHAGAPR